MRSIYRQKAPCVTSTIVKNRHKVEWFSEKKKYSEDVSKLFCISQWKKFKAVSNEH